MAISLTSTEKTDLLNRLIQWFNGEFSGEWATVYQEMEDGYKYLAGEQYNRDQRDWYKVQRRPTNVYNLLLPAYNRVIGDFLLGDLNQRIFPYAGGDPAVAEALQKYFDYLYRKQDGVKYELSKTVFAGHIKVGYIYPRYSNEKEFDGSVVISAIDEFEMLFDTRSKDDLLDDATIQARHRWLTVDQLYYLWPEHKTELQRLVMDAKDSRFWTGIDEFQSATMRNANFINQINGQYRAIEFCHRSPEMIDVALDTVTGEYDIFDIEGQKAEDYLSRNPNIQIVKKLAMVKYTTSVVPGLYFLLDHDYAQLQDGTMDYIPFSAYNYGMRTIDNFGLFKNGKGPQDGFNDWRNTTQHIINKSSNQTRLVKPNQIINYNQIKGSNEPGQDVEIDDNATFDNVYKVIENSKYPFAEGHFSEQEERLFNIIMGVNANLMGREETSNENASLFAQRVRENQKTFNIITHNLSRVKQRCFSKAIKLLQREVPTQKMFLIIDPQSTTGRPEEIIFNQQIGDRIANDLTVGEYHVFNEDIEKNPTARMLRNIEKNNIVSMTASLWGPDAKYIVPPRWWLKESELGDINEFIENWEAWRQMSLQNMMQANALNQTGALMDAAGKKMQLTGEDQDYGDPSVMDSRMGKASQQPARAPSAPRAPLP